MNWLQKIASVDIYYHGTSATRLSTILSQGLNTGHKGVWEEDPESDRSRARYGGVYLTTNFMHAMSSAGRANQMFTGQYRGDKGLIMAQIETRTPSVLIDEDAMYSPGTFISHAFNVNPNGWWYRQWSSSGFDGIEKAVDVYISQMQFTAKDSGMTNVDPRFWDNLRPSIAEMIKAFAKREISIDIKNDKYLQDKIKWSQDSERMLKEVFDGVDYSGYDLESAEQEFRQAANNFMQKAHRLVDMFKSKFLDNVRIQEPITFRGRNKIIMICRLSENDIKSKYYTEIDILYGSDKRAIDKLIADVTRSYSEYIIAKDTNGNIIYEKSRDELAV